MFKNIKQLINSEHLSGEAYFLTENNGICKISRVLLEEDARKDLTLEFKKSIEQKVINPNSEKTSVPKVSTLLERDKQVFEYDDLNIGYKPIEFDLISSVANLGINSKTPTFKFTSENIKNIKGVIFYLSDTNGNFIILYQHKYPISIHKKSKKSFFSLNGETLKKVNLDIIDINNQIDLFYFENKFYTLNIYLLENFYGLINVINNIAANVTPSIISLGIIDISDLQKPDKIFEELIEDRTSMKRLAMISKGNIIKNGLTIQQVENVISNFPIMKKNLKIKDGKIKLSSKNKKRLFIRLLNNEASFAALDNSPFLAVEKDPAN